MTVFIVYHIYCNGVDEWKNVVDVCATKDLAETKIIECLEKPHDAEYDSWHWQEHEVITN